MSKADIMPGDRVEWIGHGHQELSAGAILGDVVLCERPSGKHFMLHRNALRLRGGTRIIKTICLPDLADEAYRRVAKILTGALSGHVERYHLAPGVHQAVKWGVVEQDIFRAIHEALGTGEVRGPKDRDEEDAS